MAAAVLELFPGTKLGVGPVIEHGFFYDFDPPRPFTPEDLPKIEKRMREIIKRKEKFVRKIMSLAEAISYFGKEGQGFKVSLLEDLKRYGTTKVRPEESMDVPASGKVDEVSVYETGKFVDLCRGPHVAHSGEVGAFKLRSIAGAYWRGSEKNKQLQRIYGIAFHNEEELKLHLNMLAEAEKRDHRKLGPQLGIFMFHETSPGMPYWLPKGMVVLNKLIDFWREEHTARGYQEISTPLVNKKELWDISGHWEHYKENMFIANMGENEIYGVKAMNCPNAMIVFGSEGRSYRDLPLRLSDTDILHRYELSGTLSGLLRVRSFRQDDSHNFITEDQIEEEYGRIFDIAKKFYGIFGLDYQLRLGTRPAEFMGDAETWDKAEAALYRILDSKIGKGRYMVLEGDGAFYGPKIDILMKDSLGREWQMGTIQLDFQQPKRFGLVYTDKDGQKKTPVAIHRVIYGSLDRFIGILIEHTAGAFPLWLSPVQVYVGSVGKTHSTAVRKLGKMLMEEGIRVEMDDGNDTVGYKIRKAEKQKIPYMLVIGDKEKALRKLTVRIRGQEKQKEMSVSTFVKRVKGEVAKKN